MWFLEVLYWHFDFNRTCVCKHFSVITYDGNIKREQIVFRVNGPFPGMRGGRTHRWWIWGWLKVKNSWPNLDIHTEGKISRNCVPCLTSDHVIIQSALIQTSSWSTIKQHFGVVQYLIIWQEFILSCEESNHFTKSLYSQGFFKKHALFIRFHIVNSIFQGVYLFIHVIV